MRDVRVGQEWKDADSHRLNGDRTLIVKEIRNGYVICDVRRFMWFPGERRTTHIKLGRFKSTSRGYRLVEAVR